MTPQKVSSWGKKKPNSFKIVKTTLEFTAYIWRIIELPFTLFLSISLIKSFASLTIRDEYDLDSQFFTSFYTK